MTGIRISGFSSGIDSDEMVKKLMQAHRIPVDKLKQKKQTLEWQRDSYREMNSLLLTLRNMASDMRLQKTFLAKKATSNQESIVSAKGTNNATPGIYDIEVNRLATAATVTSSADIVAISGGTTKLSDIGGTGAGLSGNATLTIGGQKGKSTIQLKPTTTINEFVAAVNGESSITGVTVSFDANLKRFFFASNTTGSASKIELTTDNGSNLLDVLKLSGSLDNPAETVTNTKVFAGGLTDVINGGLGATQTFRINYDGTDYDFSVSSSTTIGQLIDQINSSDLAKKQGVSAYLDANNKLAFYNPNNAKNLVFSDATAGGNDILDNSNLGLTAPVETPVQAQTKTGAKVFSSSTSSIHLDTVAQTFRINYTGDTANYDFSVSSSTTIGQLIDQINSSDLARKHGVTAYLDANNKLAFSNPDKSRQLTFSDQTTSGAVDIVANLGLKGNGQVVTGGKDLGSASAKVHSDTTAQVLRINYTGDATNYEFTVSDSTTVEQLINQINSSNLAKTHGISAYLDENNKLAFFNPDNGKSLTFSDQTAGGSVDIVNSLGLDAKTEQNVSVVDADVNYKKTTIKGTDAEIRFAGVPAGSWANYSSNSFTINGIEFTAQNTGSATVTVTSDVDAVYNSIKSFVDKYNETIDKIYTKVNEKRYRDFQPLTDDQKKEMKEEDIKRWEEKAKSGILRNDGILSSVLSSLRSTMVSTVNGLPSGDLKNMAQIGITTSKTYDKYSYLEKGKLYIDEAKLRDAIANKPDQVMRLFTANDNSNESESGDGIALRIYNKLVSSMSQITTKAGLTGDASDTSLIGKDVKQIDKRIDEINERLKSMEDRYYKQFTAMEKAMSKLNAQSGWLAQQFGG